MPQQIITGTVISTTPKTISVRVERSKTHPIYRKKYNVTKKFHAHDPKNQAGVGDFVELKEVPPISKQKRWELVRVITKSVEDEVEV